MKIILGLFVALLASSSPIDGSEELITVKVRISNIEHEDSNVMIAVFENYHTFLTEDMYRKEVVKVVNITKTEVVFELAKGEYAIAAFQDKNKNGDLDRNFFAYPTERFGFSNNFRPIIKPPHWTDVAFRVENDMVIDVELK